MSRVITTLWDLCILQAFSSECTYNWTQILGPSLWRPAFSFSRVLGREIQLAGQKVGITNFSHRPVWMTCGSGHWCTHFPCICTCPHETSHRNAIRQEAGIAQILQRLQTWSLAYCHWEQHVSLSLPGTDSVHMWSSFAPQQTLSLNIHVMVLSAHFPGWLWASNLNLEKFCMWTPSY